MLAVATGIKKDQYLAPIDPNFGGCGRVLTDENGYYCFRTIKPGPYPPAQPVPATGVRRISIFSLSGDARAQRLITQMYFEGDPLIKQCPIVRTINNDDAVRTLIAELDMHAAVPLDCLAYRFDLVLRGHRATLFENRTQGGRPMKEYLPETASQTAGPYVHIGLGAGRRRLSYF